MDEVTVRLNEIVLQTEGTRGSLSTSKDISLCHRVDIRLMDLFGL